MLILIFSVAGIGTYWATAPPPDPDAARSFSLTGWLREVRRDVMEDHYRQPFQVSDVAALPEGAEALLIEGIRGRIQIMGESRRDVGWRATGELRSGEPLPSSPAAGSVRLTLTPSGRRAVVAIESTDLARAVPRSLELRIPTGMSLRIAGRGDLAIAGAGDVELHTRGDAVLRDLAGWVTGEHRGRLEIAGADGVRLAVRGGEVRLDAIATDIDVVATDGRVTAREPGGRVQVESRRADLDIGSPGGPIDIKATNAHAIVRDPRGEVAFEGQRGSLTLTLFSPVAVRARTRDETLELRVPADQGLTIDATAEGGRIRAGDLPIDPVEQPDGQHLTGRLGGGGPLLSLHTNGGAIVLGYR